MANNTTTFVPSGTSVTLMPDSSSATPATMPDVDSENLDLLITADGADRVWVTFDDAPAGPDVPGCLIVAGGATLLLTTSRATLDASSANPAVQSPQSGAWQTARQVSARAAHRGGTVTIQRGSATSKASF